MLFYIIFLKCSFLAWYYPITGWRSSQEELFALIILHESVIVPRGRLLDRGNIHCMHPLRNQRTSWPRLPHWRETDIALPATVLTLSSRGSSPPAPVGMIHPHSRSSGVSGWKKPRFILQCARLLHARSRISLRSAFWSSSWE